MEDIDWVAPLPPPRKQGVRHPFYDYNDSHTRRGPGAAPVFTGGAQTTTRRRRASCTDDRALSDIDEADGFESSEERQSNASATAAKATHDRVPPVDDEAKDFMAIKPWLGAMFPPTKYLKDPERPNQCFDADNNNWAAPETICELDYVFGYRAVNVRQNLHWVADDVVVYHAAAVGIVYYVKTTDQDFFQGHDDDIVTLDYHKPSRLVASGSIGARNSVRLCIWEVDTQKQRHCIQGFHMFAVTSVAFNPAGTIVCSLGLDEHHSAALYSVETGLLLACSPTDKSRVIHTRWNTCGGIDSNACFITVGVKHISFWTPKGPSTDKGNYYAISPEPEDQRLVWQRGFGCDEIDNIIFNAISCTSLFALIGGDNGVIYAFNPSKYDVRYSWKCSPTYRIMSIVPLTPTGDTFVTGDAGGVVSFWDITSDPNAAKLAVQNSKVINTKTSEPLDLDVLNACTNNDSDILVNSVRSLDYLPETGELLCGTILSQVYCINVAQSTPKDVKVEVYVSGHWGKLSDEEGYGEIWGVDTHPSKPWAITTAEDGTVRIWDLIDNKLLAVHATPYPGVETTMSQDEQMIAVSHENGSFTILSGDLKYQLAHVRHRRLRVAAIKFSPDRKWLAVGSAQTVDMYSVGDIDPATNTVKVKRTGVCRGHSAMIESIDWNISSTVIQTASNSYELLYFAASDCMRITGTRSLADETWWTQNCIVGWSVQGIWPRYADGSDINSVSRSRSEKLLAVTDDWGCLKLYNYPCVGGGLDRIGRLTVRPEYREYHGHCSHVTNSAWTFDDSYICTTGGADLCMMVWIVRSSPADKGERMLNAAYLKEQMAAHAEATAKKDVETLRKSPLDATKAAGATKARNFLQMNANKRRGLADSRPGSASASLSSSQVKSRYEETTATYAISSTLQRQMRKEIDARPKPHVWRPTLSANKVPPLPEEDGDSDDDFINATVMSATSVASAPLTGSLPKKSTKAKRTTGPDFADV